MDICQLCGASRDPLNTNCTFCGTAYTLGEVTGECYIVGLSAALQKIEQEAAELSRKLGVKDALGFTHNGFYVTPVAIAGRQAKVIATFAMPSDLDSMLQFFAFCHGNAQAHVSPYDHAGKCLKGAWHGKAQMAFSQLKLKAIANTSLASYVATYEPFYGTATAPGQLSEWIRKNKALVTVLMLVISIGGCFATCYVTVRDAAK